MKRLSIVAALVAIGVAVPLSIGSSHREAPLTSIDPTADDTDVYAYTAKDAPDALTVVANWVPFEDPAGGPNFYRFDQRARYYINIDNTGDGVTTSGTGSRSEDAYEKGGNSFLYALPACDSIDSPNLLQKQFYDVERLSATGTRGALPPRARGRSTRASTRSTRASTSPSAGTASARSGCCAACARSRATSPSRRTTSARRRSPTTTRSPTRRSPSCPVAARCSPASVTTRSSWISGAIFDAINIDKPGRPGIGFGNQGGGKDDLAGYGVHSIVLQVPEERVTRDGDEVDDAKDKNAVVGVWASTERKRVSVLASASRDDDDDRGRDNGDYVQVSRLGNPLVNEVIIPVKDKDKFNSTDSGPRRRAVRQVRREAGAGRDH